MKRAIKTSLRSLVSGMSTASLMTWLHRYCLLPLGHIMWRFASCLCSSWSVQLEAKDAMVIVAVKAFMSLSILFGN